MKRWLRLALALFVIVAVGAFLYFRFGSQRVNAAPNVQTATVQRGTLSATVNAAGNLTPAQQVTLNFQQSGTVKQVNVSVGSPVKAGQVLAQLDTGNLQLQLQNAQINLKVAQDKLAQAKNPNTAQDIASARAQLDAAQATYAKTTAGPSDADLAAARSGVASAQAAYDAAVRSAGTNDSQFTAAAAAVQKAQAALQAAQAAYDRVSNAPNIGMLPQATALQAATTDYQTALANYQALQATASSDANSKVQAAAAQLQQAQDSVTKLQTQVTPNDITAAKAQVTQAQDNLEKLLAGSDSNTLDIAQNTVDQAQVAVQEAQLALQQAEIIAPFDGVVTAVNMTPGQTAPSSSQGALQLADLNHMEILVNMDETSVDQVQVGQPVQITLDALPNATFTGQVALVSPAGTIQQGVVNYPVTIDLTGATQGAKSGMTANLNVVVRQRDNVLMVPNRAIHQVSATTGAAAGSQTNNGNQSSSGGATPGGAGNAAGGAGATGGNGGGFGAGGNGRAGAGQGGAGANAAGGANGSQANGGAQGNAGSGRRARQLYVVVLVNNQQIAVPVQTGISNDTMTEIVSGLQEGDVVVLSSTTTTQPRAGGGPFILGGGGGGFGR